MQMAISSLDRFMLEPDLLRRLIRGAKAGEADSFEGLVFLHERRVLRLAPRLLLNREAARNAAQDVFLRLHRKLGISLGGQRTRALVISDDSKYLYRSSAAFERRNAD